MLLRTDPFRDLDRATASVLGATAPSAPMDVVRREDGLVLTFDLPGVDPATIDLTVDRHVLTVTAQRADAAGDGDTVLVRERRHGEIARRVRLHEHLDTEALDARYEHGVLTLTVPVREAAKARRIPVAVGGSDVPAVDTADTDDARTLETAAA